MAGDEEVEAALKATEDITPWRVNRRCYIETALAAADRVRSRPAGSTTGGTEGENHEAGIEAAAQALMHVINSYCPQWDRRIDWKAPGYAEQAKLDAAFVLNASSPVSGTEPDTASELERLRSECCVCEKCGHVQAEPNWCHKCRHRTTMPDWAKPLVDAFHEREADPPEPDTAKLTEDGPVKKRRPRVPAPSGRLGSLTPPVPSPGSGTEPGTETERLKRAIGRIAYRMHLMVGDSDEDVDRIIEHIDASVDFPAPNASPDWKPRPGTEPDTAKLVEALRDPRLDGPLDRAANAYLRERESAGTAGGAARRIVTAFLTGFSVDAGKPEEER